MTEIIQRLSTDEISEYNQILKDRFNRDSGQLNGIERNGYRRESMGDANFASTFNLVAKRVDPVTAFKTFDSLLAIIDRPASGEISWEMRRYLRRVPVDTIANFSDALREYAIADRTGQLIGMNDFVWDADINDPEVNRPLAEREIFRLRYRATHLLPDGNIDYSEHPDVIAQV